MLLLPLRAVPGISQMPGPLRAVPGISQVPGSQESTETFQLGPEE